MFSKRFGRQLLSVALVAIAAPGIVDGLAAPAAAEVLYYEDFADDTLATNTTIDEGEIAGGIGSFNDDATNDKSVFNVVQDFISPLMTFSFDVVEPVVPIGTSGQTELMFRAGIGDGTDSIGSSDDIVELVLNRDLENRGGYLNNGNESVFIVVNNAAGSQNIISPVDGSSVPLNDQEFVAFIRNNDDGLFVQARGPQAWLQSGPITRFFIGSSSNSDEDTFGIDNVRVVTGAVVPEPSTLMLAMFTGLGLVGSRTRRREARQAGLRSYRNG